MERSEQRFSWSLKRRRLWNFCRRGYALHYFGAAGGHDPDASSVRRQLHHLRRLCSRESFLRMLFGDAMHTIFYQSTEEDAPPPAPLGAMVSARLERAFHAMLTGRAERDHKLPLLGELYQADTDISALHESLRREVRERSAVLERGFWGDLIRVPAEARRYLPFPLPLQIGELLCYASPLLALERNGELWIIERGGEEDDAAALMHRYYAMNALGRAPERVRSFCFSSPEWELRPLGNDLDISAALRGIREDVSAMRSLLLPEDEAWQEIPGFQVHCECCNFAPFCREREA